MLDILDTISAIIWALLLLVIVTGIILVCKQKWCKMCLKVLGIGTLLFFAAPRVDASVYQDKPDQVTRNNKIISSPSTPSMDVSTQNDESLTQAPAENTDKQSVHDYDQKSDENDGLGFWGWFWLIFFAFCTLSIFVHWQNKRKKLSKEKVPEHVLMPPLHIHPPSDFSVVNKTSAALKNERLKKEVKIFLLCVLLSGGIVAIISVPWLLLPLLIVSIFVIITYREAKKEKRFEQEVAVWQSDIPPSNFLEACEMFQELDASEYDYRLARNEKLLGVQECVTLNIGQRSPLLGRLLVTNQAIVFESPEDNERITWTRIASVTITYQGCHVSHRTGEPWNYRFSAIPNPRFVAIIRALGQPY